MLFYGEGMAATFHIYNADGGWEIYQEGVSGMVAGPHSTSYAALEAIRALHPESCAIQVHRHHIDDACVGCQRVEY